MRTPVWVSLCGVVHKLAWAGIDRLLARRAWTVAGESRFGPVGEGQVQVWEITCTTPAFGATLSLH